MSDIKTFKFDKENFCEIKEYHFGSNWPAVYLLEDGKEIYIGESTSVYNRSRQHFEKEQKRKLKNIHVISDEEYNKSAALDIESQLIQYISADEKFTVQNGNKGLSNHDYYDRDKYKAKFELIWKELTRMSLVQKSLLQIRNSQIFKYSPYKSLTDDQIHIVQNILTILKKTESETIVINGSPGTGKTIVATYLMKYLLETKEYKNMKVGLVIPMTSLRKTIRKVFSHVKGLKPGMVIGPNDVIKEKYDLLIVDEAHRLTQRKNITNFASYDAVNKKIGLGKEGTQLDWILNSSKHQIFFYDKNQTVRPADIDTGAFAKMPAVRLILSKQIRVNGGEMYIDFINNFFDLEFSECNFEEYDFKIFNNPSEMMAAIKEKNSEYDLCRVVAGYAWPWKTRKGAEFDIELGDLKLSWNSQAVDWVNSKNAINEVGCIHTVQGYDLNYAGVIIGPEISYDPINHELIIHKDKYEDFNGKRSISDPEELKIYIFNIYRTLLTRGIYGTYVYVVDESLRKLFIDASEDRNFT